MRKNRFWFYVIYNVITFSRYVACYLKCIWCWFLISGSDTLLTSPHLCVKQQSSSLKVLESWNLILEIFLETKVSKAWNNLNFTWNLVLIKTYFPKVIPSRSRSTFVTLKYNSEVCELRVQLQYIVQQHTDKILAPICNFGICLGNNWTDEPTNLIRGTSPICLEFKVQALHWIWHSQR